MTPLKKQLLGTTSLHPNGVLLRGPVAGFIATALGIGGTAGTLTFGAILSKLAVSLVASFLLQALAPKPKVGGRGLVTNIREPAAPHDIVYGRVRKGGVITYLESTGANNKFLHMIVVLAGHEVNDIGDIYVNDEIVTLDTNGFVTGTKWKSKIRINKHIGTATQTADADLLAESALIDANFRGRGIAYLYIRMEYDQNVFSNGIPLFTAEVEGKKVFDPRTSTTAWSANAALCIRDYITSAYGLNDAAIDDTMFSAAANDCDDAIPLDAGGTQPRYEMHGVLSTGDSTGTNLDKMVTSCAAALFWGQGKWKLKVGKYAAPVTTLDLDDLRGPISLSTRAARRDNFNIVRGTFNDSAQGYIVADYPELKSAPFIAEDNGIENALDFELPLTTDAAMAQRIAKLALFRAREQMTLTADFGLSALGVQVGDIIAFTNSRYGWTAKEFEVVGWNLNISGDAGDLRVSLALRETSAAAFDWNAEESDIIGNNTNLPDPLAGLTINNLVATGGGRTQSDGTFINSVILSWDDVPSAFLDFYEIEWKPLADSAYSSTTTVENGIELSPLIDGIEYVIRVRAVSVGGIRGDWATVSFTGGGDVTAPGLPTSISATGHFEYISLKWTNPADTDLNYVEIWENTSNTTAGATLAGISSGNTFQRTNLGLSQTRWYFLKSVDYSGNKSTFTSGVSATTTFLDDADFANGIYSLFTSQGLYAIRDVTSLPPSGAFTGEKIFNRTDGKLYEWTGTAWRLVVAAVNAPDISGKLQTAQIATSAITADLIAAAAITETKIDSNAITTAKIAAGAITTAKLAAGAVTANEIAANSITSAKIVAGTIQASDIATGTITATQIAASTITGDKIVANTITGGLLATSGVITNSAQINDAVITNAKIQNLAVDSAKIANLTVGTQKITDFAVSNNGGVNVASYAVNSSTFATAASFSFTTIGSKPLVVHLSFGITVADPGQNPTGSATLQLRVEGTSLLQFDVGGAAGKTTFSRTFLTDTIDTSTQVALVARYINTGVTLTDISIVAVEYKK